MKNLYNKIDESEMPDEEKRESYISEQNDESDYGDWYNQN